MCWAVKHRTVSSRVGGGASGRGPSEHVLGSLACGRVMLEGREEGAKGSYEGLLTSSLA